MVDVEWARGHRVGSGKKRMAMVSPERWMQAWSWRAGSHHVTGWITKDACLTVGFSWMSWAGNLDDRRGICERESQKEPFARVLLLPNFFFCP
jgi:hypothetical protein